MRKEIGPLASPDLIQFSPGLPKTRSGKIMRRILRKIAEDDFSNLGDTSTLAEPAVVDDPLSTTARTRARRRRDSQLILAPASSAQGDLTRHATWRFRFTLRSLPASQERAHAAGLL